MIAGLVAVVLNFSQLGATHLAEDEAQYALVTDDVLRGKWLTPSPYPPAAYDQKPPLYFWLSAMVVPVVGEPTGYRVWSALAGVVAVVMTCGLGAKLLGKWPGFAAALLLAGHMRWLLIHGARDGTMDTLLTVLHLAVIGLVVGWAVGWQGKKRVMMTAVGLALCVAVGSMLKPFFGLVLMATPVMLLPFVKGRGGLVWCVMGAAVAGSLLASPWYFAALTGGTAPSGRLTGGMLTDPLFYLRRMVDSSPLHVLVVPSLAVVGWAAYRQVESRLRLAAVCVPAVVWLGVLSVMGGKNAHYVFPVLPLMCMAICYALMVEVPRWIPALRQVMGVAVVGYGLLMVPYRLWVSIPSRNVEYAAAAFEAARDGVPMVFVGLTGDQLVWRNQFAANATDSFYLTRLVPGAAQVGEFPAAEGVVGQVVVVAPAGMRPPTGYPAAVFDNGRICVYRLEAGAQ